MLDGTTVCMPENVRVVSSSNAPFGDAECTQALFSNDPCSPADFAYKFVDDDGCGGGIETLYQFGEPFVGAVHYVQTESGCEEVDSSGSELFLLSEVEPSSVLPVVTTSEP